MKWRPGVPRGPQTAEHRQNLSERKIPDFVRSDELKVVADVHGDYWHRHDDRITVKKRCQVFAKAGVALVVIWEREFNSKPWLLTRRVRRAEKLSQARQGGKVGL